MKIRTPMKMMNCEKIAVKPEVNMPEEDVPNPMRLANIRRNNVEATLNVKVMMIMLVWNFLRRRSLMGKLVLIILLTRQFAIFKTNNQVC